jgi:hypothetical protein
VYIAGTFYNDTRNSPKGGPLADPSAEVRAHLERHHVLAPPRPPGPAPDGMAADGRRGVRIEERNWQVATMEATRIRDLTLRLGGGTCYLFCHHVRFEPNRLHLFGARLIRSAGCAIWETRILALKVIGNSVHYRTYPQEPFVLERVNGVVSLIAS